MYMPPKGIAFFKKKRKKKNQVNFKTKNCFRLQNLQKCINFLTKKKRGSLSLTIFSLIYVNFTHQICFNDVLLP